MPEELSKLLIYLAIGGAYYLLKNAGKVFFKQKSTPLPPPKVKPYQPPTVPPSEDIPQPSYTSLEDLWNERKIVEQAAENTTETLETNYKSISVENVNPYAEYNSTSYKPIDIDDTKRTGIFDEFKIQTRTNPFYSLLRDKNELRKGIILAEILQKKTT